MPPVSLYGGTEYVPSGHEARAAAGFASDLWLAPVSLVWRTAKQKQDDFLPPPLLVFHNCILASSILLLLTLQHRHRPPHARGMRLQTITRRLTTRGAPWALAAFGALFIAIAIFRDIKWALHDTQRQRFNLYNVILPQRLAFALADWENPERSSQPAVPELLAAPWMGTWPIPHLTSPRRENGTLVSPAWVMIHVFSTPSAEGAETRAYLRSMSPLLNVPPDFRHLIEVKFVMGYIIGENWLQREALDREQAKHGDLLFLTGLHDGENMNNGKTIQWIQYLGTQSVREAQWVM